MVVGLGGLVLPCDVPLLPALLSAHSLNAVVRQRMSLASNSGVSATSSKFDGVSNRDERESCGWSCWGQVSWARHAF